MWVGRNKKLTTPIRRVDDNIDVYIIYIYIHD